MKLFKRKSNIYIYRLVKIYIYTETYGIGISNSLSVWEGLRRPFVARQVVNTTRQEPEINS